MDQPTEQRVDALEQSTINSIGNLAGFVGPYAMGAIKDLTGSYTGGLLGLSVLGFRQ